MLNLAKRPLSEAIRIAVWECVNVESGNVPDAVLNMDTFGSIQKYDAQPVCHACMAGFALRGVDPDEFADGFSQTGVLSWGRLGWGTKPMMQAIDNVRGGCVRQAVGTLRRHAALQEQEEVALRAIESLIRGDESDYEDSHYPWPRYLAAADMLQELGL